MHVVTSRQLYGDADANLAAADRLRAVHIHRIWTTRMGRSRLLGRALDYTTFYASAFLWLLRYARQGDVFVALTDPPLISVASALAARMRGCTHVNWLHDLFPEIAGVLGILPCRICHWMLTRLRNWSLRCSQMNVAIGEGMADRLASQGLPANRIAVIHNWSDASNISPVAAMNNQLRTAWGLSDKFVVGYSGNLGRAHDPQTILKAAEILRHDEEIRFLFIGGGHFFKVLEAEAHRRGLTNVIFKPYQPKDQLSDSLSVADLHLISLLPKLEGLIVPSKFYSVAAAGRPTIFIGDRSGEIPRLLYDAKCGAAVAAGQGASLAHQIERLKGNRALRTLWGQNARALLEHRFDQRLAVTKWVGLLYRIGPSPRVPYPTELQRPAATEGQLRRQMPTPVYGGSQMTAQKEPRVAPGNDIARMSE